MLTLIRVIVVATLSWRKPMFGLGVFLLSQSGMSGPLSTLGILGGQLGPLRPGNVGYLVAVGALLLKPRLNRKAVDTSGIILMITLLTMLMFVSNAAELGVGRWYEIGKRAVYMVLWAPMYIALVTLDEKDHRTLREWIIALAFVTALITLAVLVTESTFLLELVLVNREVGDLLPENFSTARISVPGIWSLVPFGFWLCVWSLLQTSRDDQARRWYYALAVLVMLGALVLNLTRSLLVGIAAGWFVLLLLLAIAGPRQIKRTLLQVSSLMIIVVLSITRIFPSAWKLLLSRFAEGTGAYSLSQRLGRTQLMSGILVREMPLLGHRLAWTHSSWTPMGGDAHGLVQFWWNYGSLAAFLLLALLIVSGIRITGNLISGQLGGSSDLLIKNAVLIAIFITFNSQLAAGFYFFPDDVFLFIFYLSCIWKPLAAGNAQQLVPRRLGIRQLRLKHQLLSQQQLSLHSRRIFPHD